MNEINSGLESIVENADKNGISGEFSLRDPAFIDCRLLIADDHVLVLDMLRSLLERNFNLVGTASCGTSLLRLAQELRPELILLDIGMPGINGLETARLLRAIGVSAKLAYLSMESDPAIAAQAFALGASAYMVKTGPTAELLHALRIVASGGQYLSPSIYGGDIAALRAEHGQDPLTRLSQRELEVLKLLVTGMSMKAAARQLGIVPRTVAFHKYRAMQTLGLRDNVALLDFAVRHRLFGQKPAAGNGLDGGGRSAG